MKWTVFGKRVSEHFVPESCEVLDTERGILRDFLFLGSTSGFEATGW